MKLNTTEQTLEQITEVTVEKDPAIEEALRTFETLPDGYWNNDEAVDRIKRIVLTPLQINRALQAIMQKEKIIPYTGGYIGRLIQASYDSGNNDFMLNTPDAGIQNFGYCLEGTKEKNLRLAIIGNIGDSCGWRAKHCKFTIKGNVGADCATLTQDCEFKIDGTAGRLLGDDAYKCKFTVNGNTKSGCGKRADKCEITINGDTEEYCGLEARKSVITVTGKRGYNCGYAARNCTFIISGSKKDYGDNSEDCIFKGPDGRILRRT